MKIYRDEEILDYLNSPWYYFMKYKTDVVTYQQELSEAVEEIAEDFLEKIAQRRIMTKGDYVNSINKKLEQFHKDIPNTDILKAIKYLNDLYDYAESKKLYVVDYGKRVTLDFNGTQVVVKIGAIVKNKDSFYLFIPKYSTRFNQMRSDFDIALTLQWRAISEAYEEYILGIKCFTPKNKDKTITFRDLSSIKRLNFIVSNVIKGIEHEVFFPVREESSKNRRMLDVTERYVGG